MRMNKYGFSLSISGPLVLTALSALAAVALNSSSAAVASGCPKECSCSQDGSVVECTRNCPHGLLPQVLVLRCRYTRFKKCTSTILRAAESVEELDLSNGRISQISEDAFSALSQLEDLDLSRNHLTVIPRDAFSLCTKLRLLDLSWNPLVLPDCGPVLVSSSLSALGLANCGLTAIPDRAFVMLTALRELQLRGNPGLSLIPKCLFHPRTDLYLLDSDHNIFEPFDYSNFQYCDSEYSCRKPKRPEVADAGTESMTPVPETPQHVQTSGLTIFWSLLGVTIIIIGIFFIGRYMYKKHRAHNCTNSNGNGTDGASTPLRDIGRDQAATQQPTEGK